MINNKRLKRQFFQINSSSMPCFLSARYYCGSGSSNNNNANNNNLFSYVTYKWGEGACVWGSGVVVPSPDANGYKKTGGYGGQCSETATLLQNRARDSGKRNGLQESWSKRQRTQGARHQLQQVSPPP